MEITKSTRVYDIIKEYGDIAEVMGIFGVKAVGPFSIRRIITRFINVEKAAKIHKKPLDEFLTNLRDAVKKIE
jgi:uncharacterized protein DUF1858